VNEQIAAYPASKKAKLLNWGRLNLFSFPLSNQIPAIKGGEDTEFNLIDKKSSEKAEGLNSLMGREAVNTRLNQGEICGTAWFNSEIVSYCWVAFRQAEVGEINRIISLRDNELYLYDAFTRPEYRGKGFFPALLAAVLRFARSQGYTRALIFSLRDNRSSVRGIDKAGFYLLKSIYFIKIMGLSSCLSGRIKGNEAGVTLGR
jgi:GNAT superfamily N-acetyltransferase